MFFRNRHFLATALIASTVLLVCGIGFWLAIPDAISVPKSTTLLSKTEPRSNIPHAGSGHPALTIERVLSTSERAVVQRFYAMLPALQAAHEAVEAEAKKLEEHLTFCGLVEHFGISYSIGIDRKHRATRQEMDLLPEEQRKQWGHLYPSPEYDLLLPARLMEVLESWDPVAGDVTLRDIALDVFRNTDYTDTLREYLSGIHRRYFADAEDEPWSKASSPEELIATLRRLAPHYRAHHDQVFSPTLPADPHIRLYRAETSHGIAVQQITSAYRQSWTSTLVSLQDQRQQLMSDLERLIHQLPPGSNEGSAMATLLQEHAVRILTSK